VVNYIVQIATGIIGFLDHESKHRSILSHSQALFEELSRLDARDFLPEARYEFIVARLDLDDWNKAWCQRAGDFLNTYMRDKRRQQELRELMERIAAVLNNYGGEGWRAKTRSFSFLTDKGLREIIERDYKELTLVLFPGGAWKSTVIMAGSILEAILFDVLASDPAINAKALASSVAPKGPMEDWRLENLVKVAADIGVLPMKRAPTFDQVLRDYRNFVHPKKEIRSGHPCREGEAQLAMGGLNAVCDLLEGP
jgi:hypothetical protein